jgi:predicted TIM-barrel fold metal-dependent hydrolase
VVEPYDLWSSRTSSKWGDRAPQVRWHEDLQEEVWVLGDEPLIGAATNAMAWWDQYPPDCPKRLADVDPATWEIKARLALMDEYAIKTQILYPNVGFFAARLLKAADRELQLDIVKAYNDWQTDWSSEAPDRLIPITSLPFWDINATLIEIQRCAAMGHKGVNLTQDPAHYGQLDDRHWDPLWAACQEAGLPVNFHIATGDISPFLRSADPDNGKHANYASVGVSFFLENARTISQLICGGVCHRFPSLNFVSVESGVGWIPFALAALDWQWLNAGAHKEHPDYELLPSEFFKRQIYGCFWFEDATAKFAL